MQRYCSYSDVGSPAHTSSREDARDMLGCDGNRLKLILACLLFMMLTISVGAITAALWLPVAPLLEGFTWYENLYGISLAIDYILMLLFTLPAAFGMLTLAHRMCRGEMTETADIFYSYRHLPRTWLVTLIFLVPAIIIAGTWLNTPALIAKLRVLPAFASSSVTELVVCIGVIVAATALTVGAIILAMRGFFFPGLAMRGDMGVRRALVASFSASRGRMREIIAFVFSFTGWAVLSLVTFGVLFVIQLVPYYTASYMIYCERATKVNSI